MTRSGEGGGWGGDLGAGSEGAEADSVDLLCRVESTAFPRLPAVKSTAKQGPNKLQSVRKGVGERTEETNLAAERSQFGLLASFLALQPRQSPFPKRS